MAMANAHRSMVDGHHDDLAQLMGSRTRAGILECLFSSPGVAFGIRELASRAGGLDYKTTRSELHRLRALGIVRVNGADRSPRFELDPGHPAHDELRGLVLKIGRRGWIRILGEVLGAEPSIQAAAVFGSAAAGTATATSDIDLLVVGEGGDERFLGIAEILERQLGRHVDFLFYTAAELGAMRADPDSFVSGVLLGPVVIVKGRDVLER